MLADRVRMGSVVGTEIPGPKELVGGDMQAGYFGEVAMSELITGDNLASLVEISAGTSQYSDTAGWLKFAYQGNIQFIAKKPLRYYINWDDLNTASCVYGNKTVEIGRLTYKVRLIRGANKDPAGGYQGAINHGSEWNKLMLPIHIEAKNKTWAYPNNVESDMPYWGIDFTDNSLLTHKDYGDGSYSWCQEEAEKSILRIYRGNSGVSCSNSASASLSGTSLAGFGWRPVLELVL